jgi:Amt family ammonium transporter
MQNVSVSKFSGMGLFANAADCRLVFGREAGTYLTTAGRGRRFFIKIKYLKHIKFINFFVATQHASSHSFRVKARSQRRAWFQIPADTARSWARYCIARDHRRSNRRLATLSGGDPMHLTPPRRNFNRISLAGGGLLALTALSVAPASAQSADETAFIFNTLLFLIGGFLVMFMAAGFAMLEAGLVRSKHAATICLKNIGLYSIAGLMFYLVGYNLMYSGVDATGVFGTPAPWGPSELASDETIDLSGGYSSASDWFFQMVFVATAASIVSGAVAERVKIGPFFIFVAILTAIIYPIQGSWEWGEGWLDSQFGFSDFAGSTLVHSTGGWAALAGVILLGARTGRFVDGKPVVMHGSSLPLATLGVFILWFGWFGFNGASQLAMGSAADAVAISQIFANTNMAAAGGVVTAYGLSTIINRGKPNLVVALNGALAGLVSITAEPLTPTILEAILIGSVGAVIATYGTILLEKLKLDDVVGAIPVHLFAGIWGTLAVPITNPDASVFGQLVGVIAIGAFVFTTSFAVWFALKAALGIRLDPESEAVGGDLSELGHTAYPEFVPEALANQTPTTS